MRHVPCALPSTVERETPTCPGLALVPSGETGLSGRGALAWLPAPRVLTCSSPAPPLPTRTCCCRQAPPPHTHLFAPPGSGPAHPGPPWLPLSLCPSLPGAHWILAQLGALPAGQPPSPTLRSCSVLSCLPPALPRAVGGPPNSCLCPAFPLQPPAAGATSQMPCHPLSFP